MLEDYYDGHPNPPSEQEFRELWGKIRAVLHSKVTEGTLLATGLWSVCFDRMFSYQAHKTLYEQTHFKVKDSKSFAALTSAGDISLYSPDRLGKFDRNKTYHRLVAGFGLKKHEIKPEYYSLSLHDDQRFEQDLLLPAWQQDPSPREYDRIDSIPPSRSGHTVPPGVYNTWPGFRAERLPPVPKHAVLDLVQPILDNVSDVITGEEHLDFMIAWLAQMVQDPAHITVVACVLQGKQGIGKDIVFEFWVEKVLGFDGAHVKNCAGYQTSDPTETIFGRHAEAPANKVFLLVDEVKAETMRPLMDRLKDRITASTIKVNPKFQSEYSIRNLSNFLCTTNDMNPIPIEPEERRFVVFGCKSVKKGDTAYFQQLANHLKRDDVARAFFQYLCQDVDVTPFLPFQAHRPKTEAYVAMQQCNIPLLYKYLSSSIQRGNDQGEKGKRIGAAAFYNEYMEWGKQGNYNTSGTTLSRFGSDMGCLIKELSETDPSQRVITKWRDSKTKGYTVIWESLRIHLEKSALYDPDALGDIVIG